MVLIVSVRVVETYGNTLWWNSFMVKIILVTDCQDCPMYERFTGREHFYHTCHENNRTVKGDFMILYKFCELEEVEDE